MRLQYALAAVPVSFLIGTWLGYALSGQQPADPPGRTLVTSQPYTQLTKTNIEQKDAEQLLSLSVKVDTVHSELRAMKATLDQLSTSLQTYAASLGNANPGGNISTATYTSNEIAGFQDNIFAQLSDPGFNLNKLNATPEFQKLPDEEKKLVMDEIARRLDSGEIDKSAFLPGYDPASK